MGGRRLQERLAHLKGNKWRATRPLPPPAQSARMSADNTGIGRQQIAEKKVENRRVRDLIKSKGLNPRHYGYPSSEESTPLPTEDEGGEESNPSASTEESTQSNDDSQPPSTDEATQEAEAGSSSASTSSTPTRSGRNVRKRSIWDPSESEEAGTSASRGTKRAKPEPSKPPLKKQPVQAATKPNKQARRAPARQSVKSAADTIDSSSASSESSKPADVAKPLKKAPAVAATTKRAAPKPKATKAAPVPTEGGSADSEDSTLSASTSTGRRSKRTSRASMTKYSDYVVESSSKKSGPAAANVGQTIVVPTPAKDEPDETEAPMETVAATAPTTPIGRKTSINESALKTPSSSSTRATKSQATPKQPKAPRATAIAKKSIVVAAIPKEAITAAKPTEAVPKPTKAPKALVIAKKTVPTKTAAKSINVTGSGSNTTAQTASTAPSTKATVTATKRTTKKNEPSANATAGPSTGASSGNSTGTSAAPSALRGGKRAKPTPPTELNVQVNYALITTDCPVLKEASNNPTSQSPPSKRTKLASPVLSKHETENMPVSLERLGDNLDDKDLLADTPATKIFTESKKRGRKGDAATATTAAAKASVSPDTQLKDLYSNLQKWKSTLNNAQVPELSKTKKGTAASAQPSNSDDNANQMADQIDPIKIINSFFDFQMEDSREDFEWLEAQLAVNGQRSMAMNITMINIQVEGMTNAKHMQQWFATLLVLKMTKRISNLEYTSAKQRLLTFMSAESRSVSQTAMDNHFLAQNLYEAFYFVVTKLVDLAQKWKAEYLMVRGPNCKGTPLERIRGMWDSCWTELVQFTTEILGRMPKYPRASDNCVSFSTLFLFTIFVAKFWYGKLLLSNDIVPVAKLNSNEPAQGELNTEFDPSVSAVTKLATFLLQSPVYSDTNEAIPEIARLLYRLVIYKEDGKLVLTSGEALDLVQQFVVIVPSADKTAHFLPHLFYLGYAALRYHLLFDNGAKNQLGRIERLDSTVIDTWVQVYSKMQVPLTIPGANNNNRTQAQWDSLASTAAIDAIIRLFNAVFAKYIANSERVETWESNEFDQMLDYFGAIRRPEQFQALSTLCSIRQIISEAVISL